MAITATSTKPRYTKAQLKAKIGRPGRKPAEFYDMFPKERPAAKAAALKAAALKAAALKAAALKAAALKATAKKVTRVAKTKTIAAV